MFVQNFLVRVCCGVSEFRNVPYNPEAPFLTPFNPLTPNDPYKGRTAPLTFKVSFCIFIQQI